MAGATRVALTLFKRSPLSLNDPSAWYIWTSVPWTAGGGPHSDAVKARLAGLNSGGYFDDRHCAESYVDGTRNGLLTQPKVLSGRANANGSVTVVLRRRAPHSPNLRNGTAGINLLGQAQLLTGLHGEPPWEPVTVRVAAGWVPWS